MFIQINHLSTLLELYPNAPWDYRRLSSNPNLPFWYVKENPNKSWDWFELSRIIRWEDIHNNLHLPWDWDIVSRNPSVTLEITEKYPHFAWCKYGLCRNPNVSWEYLKKHAYNIANFGEQPCVTEAIIEENPQLPWNYNTVSRNPNLSWQWISQKPANWWSVAQQPYVTWDIIQENLEKFDPVIEAYSFNPNLTGLVIKQNIARERWCWYGICISPNISLDFLLRYYGYSKGWFSHSPNITWKFVVDHFELINFDTLSFNKFNKHPKIRARQLAKWYLHRWRLYAKQRAQQRNLLYLTLHELKLRTRDHSYQKTKELLLYVE